MPATTHLSPNEITVELGRYLADFTACGVHPFDWGSRNCVHFCGGWWLRMTGVDALAELEMPSTAGAVRRWLRAQSGTLADVVTLRTGRAPLPCASLAHTGDVVALPVAVGGAAGMALGICAGRVGAVLTTHGDIGFVPLAGALRAWPLQREALAAA